MMILLMDAANFSGWDKLGAVAVCMVMLCVLVGLHRNGLKRINDMADRHMAFVERQTEALVELRDSDKTMVISNDNLHRRLDALLTCRKIGCPIAGLLAWQEKSDGAGDMHAGPKGPLP